jgi:hypothetical protein
VLVSVGVVQSGYQSKLALEQAGTNGVPAIRFRFRLPSEQRVMECAQMAELARRTARAAVDGTLAAAFACAIAGAAAAQPALLGLPRPAEAGAPVVVRAGFDLRDINEINDEEETFQFEGVLILDWHDARQAFDPAVEGVNEKL